MNQINKVGDYSFNSKHKRKDIHLRLISQHHPGMQQQRICILQADQSLIHWASTESKYANGYLKYAHISRHLIYLIDLQTDINLHNNSPTYGDILLM